MNKISKKTLAISLASISLWMIGSFILFQEKNGKTTMIITAIVIMGGLYAQIKKDRRAYSEL
ncbi:hypothetical protein GUB10_15725 [Salegentibacter sp. BLCTC]|uniref:hypothetical protein n=1 Tax=Salegentibacter sp. BLCTC TaxID=2697368 RepID=UPI00187BB179|nr:hypothetical protein [Salegentibacter sp. BLCTC]MBE7641783.1 hypothetical protein [Salegentibacter sp. BLCTC]